MTSELPLTPDRLREIQALFDAVLELPEERRASYLASASNDPALINEAKSLLEALERAGETFPPLPSEAIAHALREQDDRYLGARIGNYEIARPIGTGGMGAVYEGVRADDQFRRRVAIKLLRRGIEGDLAIRRFRYERQILANLNHRNIAALLDGGMTADGQPYIVMEYVAGDPITTWCDRRRCSVSERIGIFLQVCAAVQHAHQNLVIHRDLKPGNILVTEDGTVKLLDFGIAKLLREEEGLEQLPPTQGGLRALTPDYAAPEQLRGLAIGTAADVYALGVVLFELLTGRRPFTLEGKLLVEIERIVCEEPVPRPSSVTLPGFAERASERSLAKLRSTIEGDLDAIVLTALRKEPERRYGSADRLANDLRRYLQGLPVSARRDRFSYRAAKLLRRHRIEFVAVALLLLSLVGGVIMTARQASLADRERVRAEELNRFLVDMLGAPDPGSFGRDVPMRVVLDSAASKADQLATRPALEAEVRSVIARTYAGLGEVEKAEAQWRRAVALRRQLAPTGDHHLALALGGLGHVLEDQGRLVEADSLHHAAWGLFLRTAPTDDSTRGTLLGSLGQIRQKLGDLRGAERYHRQALAVREQREPRDWDGLVSSYNDLAVVMGQSGRYRESDSLHRLAIQAARTAHGPEHPAVALALGSYAAGLDIAGHFDRADSVYKEALAMRRKLLGPAHPDYLWTVFNYAQFAAAAKRWEDARQASREVLSHRGRALPEGHPAVAAAMQALGLALGHLDSLEAGGRWLRESLELRRRTLPAGHWLIASSQSVLGEHLTLTRQWREAEQLLLGAERVLVAQRGDKSPQVRDARTRLVSLYRAWGKPLEAARWQARRTAATTNQNG